jgi:hypothetical protein
MKEETTFKDSLTQFEKAVLRDMIDAFYAFGDKTYYPDMYEDNNGLDKEMNKAFSNLRKACNFITREGRWFTMDKASRIALLRSEFTMSEKEVNDIYNDDPNKLPEEIKRYFRA